MQGAFYGIGAAVIAIIARSAYKLTQLTLGTDRLLWGLFAGARARHGVDGVGDRLGLRAGGVVSLLVRAAPARSARRGHGRRLVPLACSPASPGPPPAATLWTIGWYFAEAGAFVFGSGLAIVPFLHGGVVKEFHWLDERQFLDAVAVAMITPGPVVITVAFIGYLVAGFAGAVVAALAAFLPCYLFVVIPAPHFRRLSQTRAAQGLRRRRARPPPPAPSPARPSSSDDARSSTSPPSRSPSPRFFVLMRVKRIPEPALIAAAGVLGVLLKPMTDTLLLTRQDVADLLPMRDCIEAVEAALRTQGEAEVPSAVMGLHAPAGGFHVKAAGLRSGRLYVATKINANFPGNPRRSGLPTIQGLVALYDGDDGRPLAVMDSIEVTALRTAAATAVAARVLARSDAGRSPCAAAEPRARIRFAPWPSCGTIAEVRVHDRDA